MKIIIAEDDRNLLKMLEPYFSGKNYEIDCVTGGEELLKKIAEKKYDLIMADLNIPSPNGLEAFRKIRSMEEYKNVPVILWSGIYIEEGLKLEAEEMKVKFLKKPFGISRLQKAIDSINDIEIIDNFGG